MIFCVTPLYTFSRRSPFTPNCRRYHRTKSLRPGDPPFTMLSSARFRAVSHTRSFLNSKFVMTLVHLKIEKCWLERARPMGGVDLVLTEWTPSRKSTHKMKNRSWVWCSLEVSAADYGAPKTPCGSGSSTTIPVVRFGGNRKFC